MPTTSTGSVIYQTLHSFLYHYSPDVKTAAIEVTTTTATPTTTNTHLFSFFRFPRRFSFIVCNFIQNLTYCVFLSCILQGFAKLVFLDVIISPKLISQLIVFYFDPANEALPKLRQVLSALLDGYPTTKLHRVCNSTSLTSTRTHSRTHSLIHSFTHSLTHSSLVSCYLRALVLWYQMLYCFIIIMYLLFALCCVLFCLFRMFLSVLSCQPFDLFFTHLRKLLLVMFR